ncbi:MAG TPA: dihydrofolate reductase family protein [Nocardioides sp.]|nr:dihydrofolate reductase family protein [Nocardioides sp.]
MTHRLVVTENITLDGRIEFLDPWFDPSPRDQDVADLQEEMDRQGRECAAMLLGRQTFLDFRGYWPDHTDEPAGASLARLQKYVVSRSLGDPGWQRSTVLSGDPLDEVRRLKGAGDGDLVVTGSITLTHALFDAGLVDEVRLFLYPAVQGRGRGLTADGSPLYGLTLLESRSFRGGVTLLRYAVG